MWCGVVWCGVVWCGVVWCGVVWCGVVWCGVVWCGVVWCGVVWCGVVWCGVVWCGVVWCGVVWCGVVWCGVVWCGVVWWCDVPLGMAQKGNNLQHIQNAVSHPAKEVFVVGGNGQQLSALESELHVRTLQEPEQSLNSSKARGAVAKPMAE